MTGLAYRFRLTEEIARWTFEVHVRRLPDWSIAFTNPTAGPWKRLMAYDQSGSEGEVHRFLREETRPDLVLVNDDLKVVCIIEAKDALPPLLDPVQVAKSCAVVKVLSATLRSLGGNSFWGERAHYTVIPGLLWASESPTRETERARAFSIYSVALELAAFRHPGLVAVEARRSGDAMTLSAYANSAANDSVRRALTSLKL